MRTQTKSYIFALLLTMIFLIGCAGGHQESRVGTVSQASPAGQKERDQREKVRLLQMDLAALNGRTNVAEAGQVAQTAVHYSALLAEQYDLVRPAVFHNVLVRVGVKERGLCHHWTADLMKAFEHLQLKTYRLYWGVAHRGSELREHNCVVIVAKGQRFEQGIVLDPWRNSGELYWSRVKNDRYPWRERPRHEW